MVIVVGSGGGDNIRNVKTQLGRVSPVLGKTCRFKPNLGSRAISEPYPKPFIPFAPTVTIQILSQSAKCTFILRLLFGY